MVCPSSSRLASVRAYVPFSAWHTSLHPSDPSPPPQSRSSPLPPVFQFRPRGSLLPPPHSPSHSFLPIPPLLHLSWFTFYIYRVFFPFLFRPKEEEEETAPASTTNFLSPRPNLEFASFVPLPDINEAREEESGGGSATP